MLAPKRPSAERILKQVQVMEVLVPKLAAADSLWSLPGGLSLYQCLCSAGLACSGSLW